MSLENLLVHETGALVIDMGMCLLIPLEDDEGGSSENNISHVIESSQNQAAAMGLTASMKNMSMNGGLVSTSVGVQPPELTQQPSAGAVSLPIALKNGTDDVGSAWTNARAKRRYMMKPQGTCGKWIYMSPEIYKNREPFDGYTVDMWAAGVILFLMVTGFPPWERACQTDERFKYMTAGYLVQMLTEWNLGLSSDLMDLLQRMLFLDPKDRLSLDQVRAHPWMVNGPMTAPPSVSSIWE